MSHAIRITESARGYNLIVDPKLESFDVGFLKLDSTTRELVGELVEDGEFTTWETSSERAAEQAAENIIRVLGKFGTYAELEVA